MKIRNGLMIRKIVRTLNLTGSLKILKEIVVHPDIRKAITQMGGIELMVIIFFINPAIVSITFLITSYKLIINS